MILLTNNRNREEQVDHIVQKLQKSAASVKPLHRITFPLIVSAHIPPTPCTFTLHRGNNRGYNVKMIVAKYQLFSCSFFCTNSI